MLEDDVHNFEINSGTDHIQGVAFNQVPTL